MYFIQGENMATNKDDNFNSIEEYRKIKEYQIKVGQAIDDLIGTNLTTLIEYGLSAIAYLPEKAEKIRALIESFIDDSSTTEEPPIDVVIDTQRPIIHRPEQESKKRDARKKKFIEILKKYPEYVKDHGPKLISILENAGVQTTIAATSKKAKVNPLKQLQSKIPEKNCIAISKAIINYFDVVEKAQIAIAEEIDKIIPEGIELTPIKIEKVVPPYVDVKIPVPEPRIPLDPKIPIPYPKTPLDPKIPIPRPEIRICGPIYDIKKLEVQLAEVERIRKSLPKNATKAEKKAAANAEQQIKNLLKAAKRAEPKAAKKAVVKKATVKKATKKKK